MIPAPLALSLGDPAGIGPEIIVKAWQALRHQAQPFFVVGDARLLTGAPVQIISQPDQAAALFADALPVLNLPLSVPVRPGHPDPAHAPQIIEWIETAVRLALSGIAAGVVTAPIAKAPLYASGFKFPGHTEFLGELTQDTPYSGTRGPIMMLTAADLRTTLVTIHEPLSRVSAALSLEAILHAAQVTHEALKRDFGIDAPRLAVAGLNPHAGESGQIGREEVEIVAPAVAALNALSIDARGPFPSDTLFPAEVRATYDAAICLYHDQALIPIKMLDFWGGVNVTLGLPIVRTSPDHGTAFDIAGKSVARADSLIAALRLAHDIAARRRA